MIYPPQWTTDAACLGSNPAAWFVGQGQAGHVTKLRAVCARCPVRDECLALAMDAERGTGINRRHGIYGGLTPRERLRLASKRQEKGAVMTTSTPATAVCPQCGPTTLHRHLDWPTALARAGCGRLDSAAGWTKRVRREA